MLKRKECSVTLTNSSGRRTFDGLICRNTKGGLFIDSDGLVPRFNIDGYRVVDGKLVGVFGDSTVSINLKIGELPNEDAILSTVPPLPVPCCNEGPYNEGSQAPTPDKKTNAAEPVLMIRVGINAAALPNLIDNLLSHAEKVLRRM